MIPHIGRNLRLEITISAAVHAVCILKDLCPKQFLKTFVSISSTSSLDGKTSVGINHSTAVVVATVAILAIVVRLVRIGVVLQGNLLLTLLPGCGVLLLLRNHLGWRGNRL